MRSAISLAMFVVVGALSVGLSEAQLTTTGGGAGSGNRPVDQALEKLARQFEAAFNKKDAVALALLYAEDAILMPPNRPLVTGRQAIQAFYAKEFEQGLADLKLKTIASSSSGQLGFDVGQSDVQVRPGDPSGLLLRGVGGGGAVRAQGKYVTIYKRVGPDWKIAYDIFNDDKATP